MIQRPYHNPDDTFQLRKWREAITSAINALEAGGGGGGGGLTEEQIQDMLSSFLVAGSNISLTYNDGANTLTITGADASLNLDGGNAASVGSALPAIDGGGA